MFLRVLPLGKTFSVVRGTSEFVRKKRHDSRENAGGVGCLHATGVGATIGRPFSVSSGAATTRRSRTCGRPMVAPTGRDVRGVAVCRGSAGDHWSPVFRFFRGGGHRAEPYLRATDGRPYRWRFCGVAVCRVRRGRCRVFTPPAVAWGREDRGGGEVKATSAEVVRCGGAVGRHGGAAAGRPRAGYPKKFLRAGTPARFTSGRVRVILNFNKNGKRSTRRTGKKQNGKQRGG